MIKHGKYHVILIAGILGAGITKPDFKKSIKVGVI